MTVKTALEQGAELLEHAQIVAPRLTAEVLLAYALDCDRTYLFAHPEHELPDNVRIPFGRFLHERIGGKPTQYIIKRQEFYGREFRVTPAVLIPRPETEHLVETVLRWLRPGMRVVDVGCGSGAIAATLSVERSVPVLATDISCDALAVARCNAEKLGAKVTFVAADLLAPVRGRSLDIVASNPPYVGLHDRESLQREVRDFEPEVALYGGETGNEIYARLIAQAEYVLCPGGRLAMELGYRSLEAVQAMLEARWTNVEAVPDLAGIPRVITAELR